MQTTILEQVKAIQRARSYPVKPTRALIQGRIAKDYDLALNDAGTLLIALKMIKRSFIDAENEKEAIKIMLKFFNDLK